MIDIEEIHGLFIHVAVPFFVSCLELVVFQCQIACRETICISGQVAFKLGATKEKSWRHESRIMPFKSHLLSNQVLWDVKQRFIHS